MKRDLGIQKLLRLFTPRERKHAWVILGFTVLTGFAQSLGVISVLPFINVVLDPEVIFRTPILEFVYDLFGFTRALHFLMFLGGVVFFALFASNVISAFTLWMKTRFMNQQTHRMSVRLMAKYLSNPYEFFLTRNTNDMSKNILAEVGLLNASYLMALMEVITNIFVLFFIIITIFVIDFFASIIALLIFGTLYGTVMLYLRQKLRRRGELVRKENLKRYRFTSEALSSFKTTKVMHAEPHFIGSYEQASSQFAKHNTYAMVVGVLPRFMIEIIAVGGLVVFVLVQLALSRELESLAPVVGVLGLAGYRMLPALQNVFQGASSMQFSKPVLERLYDDLYETKDLEPRDIQAELSANIDPLGFKKSIEVKDAKFFYQGTEFNVLNGLSISIQKGQRIGLIGETGSGKTTLVDLLMGLLRLSGGSIQVDGTPLDDTTLKAWQKNLGYVPQEIYLSDESLTKNIAFGVPDEAIDMERVRRAAKLAALAKFVETELPKGYDTVVGERGVRLSGGQRQRIGIARALYRDPSVLILDEATSALDGTTEETVLSAINEAAKDRTVIMVAHRLNTLVDCDVIYLIEKGNISASGTYQSLLETNETFQRMAKEPQNSNSANR